MLPKCRRPSDLKSMNESLGPVVYISGWPVEPKGEIAVWDGIGDEELAAVRLEAEQTPVIGPHVEIIRPLIDDAEQRLQSFVECC
jgi:hypothetical protein